MLAYEKMLFCMPPDKHSFSDVSEILKQHPEIRFVSFIGIDLGGHGTDEKIPAELFLANFEKFMREGVQTDGSSVVLPKIAELNDAKVDIVPDASCNWYVDHNYEYLYKNGLPVGTLRIPAYLKHNGVTEIGSRAILRDSVNAFKRETKKLLKENPYVFEYMDIGAFEEIDDIIVTSATELEFWVKTPDDKADKEQLSTAQLLKEQYWKRTRGPVRTALENTLLVLEQYGFDVEMGHKEVGGVPSKMGNTGHYDHVMEQLEIDWKYTEPVQAADNEKEVRHVVRDIFSLYGLDVTFSAKPIDGVAGSGEHTHLGAAVKLKNGKIVSLFAPADMKKHFLSPVGFGAIMGLLKNYEMVNPFISHSNDAFMRLKPGYEAPVCIVTSLGHNTTEPSRNRTVLAGLVRDMNNPLSTRFELRSPNPKSNTYLVLAASYMAMLDGISACLSNQKNPDELLASISKKYGDEDFYLEKDREYRSERNVFTEYTQEERDRLFSRAPETVWENISAFDNHSEKLAVFEKDGVMDVRTLESYKAATLANWATELHNRIIPNTMDLVRECKKLHEEGECSDIDRVHWREIQQLRVYIGQDSLKEKSLLSRIKTALDEGQYESASELQKEMERKSNELNEKYLEYKKNLL